MLSDSVNNALTKLQAHDVKTMTEGLEELQRESSTVDDRDLGEVISAVSALFYLDTYEYPHFQSVVDNAIEMISNQGERVVPHLLGLLGDSDFKVEFNYALIFGKIGAPAIRPLLKAQLQLHDSTESSFIIYSLGKIKSEQIKEAIPMLLESFESASKDIRDSAARTLGKIAENVPASRIDRDTSNRVFDALITGLKDTHSGVRSKCCRSLGKMARNNFLAEDQIAALKKEIDIILGRGEEYKWDTAFVVRREAAEVDEILSK